MERRVKMIKLYHYNDDKCKEQSHEIYSRDLQNLFGIHLTGYGATKEEAFQDFVNNGASFYEIGRV